MSEVPLCSVPRWFESRVRVLGIQPRVKSLRSFYTGLYPRILHGVVSPDGAGVDLLIHRGLSRMICRGTCRGWEPLIRPPLLSANWQSTSLPRLATYRGTSLIRKRIPLEPSRTMPRVQGRSSGGGQFLMSELTPYAPHGLNPKTPNPDPTGVLHP